MDAKDLAHSDVWNIFGINSPKHGCASEDEGDSMKTLPVLFEQHEIRRIYDEKAETWYFSVVDILQVLIQQPDYQAARKYWKVLKGRLAKDGSQLVTNCYQLKMVFLEAFRGLSGLSVLAHSRRPSTAEHGRGAEADFLDAARGGRYFVPKQAHPGNGRVDGRLTRHSLWGCTFGLRRARSGRACRAGLARDDSDKTNIREDATDEKCESPSPARRAAPTMS